MMNISIEKAGFRDLDAVAALYGAVCGYLADKPFNPGWRRDIFPAREDAEQYLAAGGLYVAWTGGEAVGSIALTQENAGQEDHILIQAAAVHPEHLRRGIGSALLDFAAKTAEARGAKALRLHVWEGNSPAIRAYEKSGYIRLGREDIGLGEFGLDWFFLYEKRLDG